MIFTVKIAFFLCEYTCCCLLHSLVYRGVWMCLAIVRCWKSSWSPLALIYYSFLFYIERKAMKFPTFCSCHSNESARKVWERKMPFDASGEKIWLKLNSCLLKPETTRAGNFIERKSLKIDKSIDFILSLVANSPRRIFQIFFFLFEMNRCEKCA